MWCLRKVLSRCARNNKKDKTPSINPKLNKEIILQSPNLLRDYQTEFLKLEEFMQVDFFLVMVI